MVAVSVEVPRVVVKMRYLNVCGTAAWYCANSAKTIAVGPEGR